MPHTFTLTSFTDCYQSVFKILQGLRAVRAGQVYSSRGRQPWVVVNNWSMENVGRQLWGRGLGADRVKVKCIRKKMY